MTTRPHLFILLTALTLPTALLAGNGSVVRSPLVGTGLDPDATGTIFSTLQAAKSRFEVDVSRLDPTTAYSLKVGELSEATFTTDKKGHAHLRFDTPAGKGKPVLDFDPRGKTVAVLDGNAAVVLQATVSGVGEPATIAVDESADLVAQTGVPGKASARFVAKKDGSRTFEVVVAKTAEPVLHLFVNGIARGDIAIRGKAGKQRFASTVQQGQVLLDFDPRDAQIDLFGDAGVLKFTGVLAARAAGVNFALRSVKGVSIPATASAPAGAHAEAKLRVQDNARKEFSVEVEDVPAGDYDVLVGDVVRGTVTVATRTAGGTQGELEFSNDDDRGGKLPLDFDPVGATVSIRQGATIFFTGTFNPAAGSTAPAPVAGTPTTLTEALASTGLDPDASGSAEFQTAANGEMEFEVEIEDVDAGKYQLFIGGTVRGTISAAADSTGTVRGKVKFKAAGVRETHTARRGGSDDPAGDDRGGNGGGTDDPAGDDHGGGGGSDDNTPAAALRFDPRGQLLEIKSAAGTLFSHVFGDGSAPTTTGGGTAAVPGTFTVALISSGADADATARAEWKRDDRSRESFEVEVEDLPAGSYELVVGGTVRGNISVTAAARGTRGQLEFETDDDGSLPLNFDPLGQVITIRANGVTYFERTFPSGS